MSERKSQLKTILKSPKRSLKSQKDHQKTIYLSWQNYDRKKDKWCIVKAEKGGGSKQVKLSLDSTKDDILKECVEHFWNKRNKNCFTDSYFLLANFKHETIGDIINNGNDSDIPFTLGNYCDFYKIARPRIFFRTKPKTPFQRLVDNVSKDKIDSDDDFDDFQPSVSLQRSSLSTITASSSYPLSSQVTASTSFSRSAPASITSSYFSSTPATASRSFSSSTPVTATASRNFSLLTATAAPTQRPIPVIDITQESMELVDRNSNHSSPDSRRILIDEQDREFEESLKQDRQKEVIKQGEEAELQRLEKLRVDRLLRVQPELSLEDDHIVVAVRHPNLKTQTRFFKPDSLMAAVYDWVGSLSTQPENFQLYNAERVPVAPFHKVEPGVFNMGKIDQPLLLTPSGTVAFQGYTVAEDTFRKDQTYSQLSESDVLQERRHLAFLALKEDSITGTVNRDEIYKSLISFYTKANADQYQTLVLTLENEDAVGEGVAKDAISNFFEQFTQKWEGSREVFPNVMERECEIIGKIITHAFLLYDMFPTSISHASLKYHLFGTINDNDLLTSFYNHLPEKEAELLQKFNDMSCQAAIDIFAECQIFEKPTEKNIKILCIEAAKVCLIQKPCFQMMQLAQGMTFFKTLGPEAFDSLYNSNLPSSELLIEKISVTELSNHEQKITTWVHRYIRSCNTTELSTFLRYVTASASMPKKSIKLEYVNQPMEYIRPMSQTCFCILFLPRQYQSFSQLRNNLNRWIQNDQPENWKMQDD